MSKKTLEAIVLSGNEYVVQVKANQKKLLNKCSDICLNNKAISTFESQEKSHGRYEIRRLRLFQIAPEAFPDWKNINRIIEVERLSQRKKGINYETSYYISSLKSDSSRLFATGIRGHWSIENRLHWVKDVIQNEDNARIKKGNGVETLSIFKNIAINICRQNGYDSIKYASIYFASNVKELYNLIRT